jgi:hypothetical protein
MNLPVVGDQLLTVEDLGTLDQCPTDELCRNVEGGAMQSTLTREQANKAISSARILYARLLAGLIPPDEMYETERALVGLINAGGWPWYKSDLRCIWLAIRGTGNMPGYPLKEAQRNEEARAS